MARNGSGTYNLPAGNPVTTGTTISSTWANSTLSDMATALTGSIASDGQTTASGNLPMGNYIHTNVGNATLRNNYASAAQVQDGSLTYLSSVSGADTITATGAVGMSAYATGQQFTFVAAGANTGAATLNINSIGAKAITKNGITALSAGDIASGSVAEVVYDGTQFQLISGIAGLSTPISAANGGTGLTSPGTTGNVLTSNGTAWVSSAPGFPSGTRMSFNQTSAPTGWTKDTTAAINDAILRLVTGSVSSGGSVAFSTWNSSGTTGAYTLATTDIPAHTHTIARQGGLSGGSGFDYVSNQNGTIASGSTGGGGSHSHSLSNDIKYYDFIIASKD